MIELSLESGGVTRRKKCPNCKSRYLHMQRYVLNSGDAHAIVFIQAHRRTTDPELFITAILGDWSTPDSDAGRVTFSCRFGSVEGHAVPACTLIDVPDSFDSPITGKRLSREEGLKDPRINEFWSLVDFLLESDKDIHDFLHHPLKSRLKHIFPKGAKVLSKLANK
jgi:hypothetical protein